MGLLVLNYGFWDNWPTPAAPVEQLRPGLGRVITPSAPITRRHAVRLRPVPALVEISAPASSLQVGAAADRERIVFRPSPCAVEVVAGLPQLVVRPAPPIQVQLRADAPEFSASTEAPTLTIGPLIDAEALILGSLL
jgi:hypothetical protein